MSAADDVKQKVAGAVDRLADDLESLSHKIHDNPELCFKEEKAHTWLTEFLEKHGAKVERGVGGLPTAFRARAGAGSGPRVAILAEYDALPVIGHACGHNLIAAGALGAFLALARQKDGIKGTVELVGTPAEEGGGGKIKLLDAGIFDGVDAAMMFHPFDRDLVAHLTLATYWIEMRFSGKPSHAAIAPWDGRSALTACLSTFHLIDAQRVHFRDGVRVHGFITNGGQAVNIIPELATAEFSVRAKDVEELARVKAIVERCAVGAALACGVEVSLSTRQGYKDLVTNLPLARRFGENMRALGRAPAETDESVGAGSTDMGDISHAIPAIHPWIAICKPNETTCHQRAFAERAGSDEGQASMIVGAKALALTAADVLESEELLAAIRRAFELRRGASGASVAG
jgi:amidohydrolase